MPELHHTAEPQEVVRCKLRFSRSGLGLGICVSSKLRSDATLFFFPHFMKWVESSGSLPCISIIQDPARAQMPEPHPDLCF